MYTRSSGSQLVGELPIENGVFRVWRSPSVDVSLAFARESAEIQDAILGLLEEYSDLNPEQHLVAETYRWWLEDQRRLAQYAEHVYLLQPGVGGVHRGLELLMTEVHPLENEVDARDYVERSSRSRHSRVGRTGLGPRR